MIASAYRNSTPSSFQHVHVLTRDLLMYKRLVFVQLACSRQAGHRSRDPVLLSTPACRQTGADTHRQVMRTSSKLSKHPSLSPVSRCLCQHSRQDSLGTCPLGKYPLPSMKMSRNPSSNLMPQYSILNGKLLSSTVYLATMTYSQDNDLITFHIEDDSILSNSEAISTQRRIHHLLRVVERRLCIPLQGFP